MGIATDLFREILAVLLIVAATVLAALGRMTTDQWTSFAQIIFGIFVAGKTATSVTDLMTAHKRSMPAPTPAPIVIPTQSS
jgi:type IV secretory pathway VirB2 component (pilin)